MRILIIVSAASIAIASASAASAQVIPGMPLLPGFGGPIPQPTPPPPGSLSAFARSVNGLPPSQTVTKTGPGTFVSATASSTPGGFASSSASASVFSISPVP